MGKRRRKPAAPRQPHQQAKRSEWDHGPGTPAQRAGTVVEDAAEVDPDTGKKRNPNNAKRLRRIDVVEMYQRKGAIGQREVKAAKTLRDAYEATMKSPPAIREVQVDVSPDPGKNVAASVDRISRYVQLMDLVPSAHREIIETVAVNGRPISDIKRFQGRRYVRGLRHLQEALGELADSMELR